MKRKAKIVTPETEDKMMRGHRKEMRRHSRKMANVHGHSGMPVESKRKVRR